MTRIGLESLTRELSAELGPVAATVTMQAIDANGDHVSVTGRSIVFSPRNTFVMVNGVPAAAPDLQPTDGSFAWQVRVSIKTGSYSRTWVKGVPDSAEVVPFGDLPNLDPKTLQPTEDIVAAWDEVRAEAAAARDDAAESASAAGASAGTASVAASAAASSATAASTSAATAATAAEAATTASSSAGVAAGAAGLSAAAADESARSAAASSSAASQAKTASASSESAAAASATSAQHSATAASGSATGAAASASTASAAATTATDASVSATSAKTASAQSATIADTRATDAAGSATAAEQSAAVADQRATAAGQSATAAAGSATSAGTAKTAAETARTGAETAQTGAQTARTGAEAARDLALAGQFAGSDLGTAHLDTITTPGKYRQSSGVRATIAQGYPEEGSPLDLTVSSSGTGGAGLVQRGIVPWRTGRAGMGEWLRTRFAATDPWGPWRFSPIVEVDQAVGRVYRIYDHVNARMQMIHGDTGRRVITTMFTDSNGTLLVTNGSIILRRVGQMVSLEFSNVAVSGQVANSSYNFPNAMPAGFRPATSMRLPLAQSTGIGVVTVYANSAQITLQPGTTATLYQGSLVWFTNDPWPTVAPGGADGIIPAL